MMLSHFTFTYWIFFESVLGLTVWSGMKEIPILLVDVETMNTAASSFGHAGIWGLTVWHSRTSVIPAAIQSMLGLLLRIIRLLLYQKYYYLEVSQ